MTISQTSFSDELYVCTQCFSSENIMQSFLGNVEAPVPDVRIITSNGLSIPAHSSVLALASTVLEKILDQQPRIAPNSEKTIPILGVPCHAIVAFLRFLYSSRYSLGRTNYNNTSSCSCSSTSGNGDDQEMEMSYDIIHLNLLALSHVYAVPQLKQRCTKALAARLTVENVIDVLQLARLCDAPDLYLKCMKLISNNFKAVEMTEAWNFMHNHDPWLELEILQFIDDTESREKRRRRKKKEQCLYRHLSEAMECLEHICTQGCTAVGPVVCCTASKKKPCSKFSTCQGLQLLIIHFATCKKKVNGGCSRCKRMWQLFKLHSSVCNQNDRCRVPLCRQFKVKMEQDKKGDSARWRLLVRKEVEVAVIQKVGRGDSSLVGSGLMGTHYRGTPV
ncbi:hypothetical protein IFM89_036113, partial [Coptis chinensis]